MPPACPRPTSKSDTFVPVPASSSDPIQQDDGVEDQAERAELVLHAVTVRLVDGAALAVAHVPGQHVAGFLHGELPVHLSAVVSSTGSTTRSRVLGRAPRLAPPQQSVNLMRSPRCWTMHLRVAVVGGVGG
ncbi:hypothetical protein ACE1SV_71040 [Streptomyces sennicomposti]